MTGGYEFEWDGKSTTGWAFTAVNSTQATTKVFPEKIVQFGEFQIGSSVTIPKGIVYLGPPIVQGPECLCQTSPVDCKVHADV